MRWYRITGIRNICVELDAGNRTPPPPRPSSAVPFARQARTSATLPRRVGCLNRGRAGGSVGASVFRLIFLHDPGAAMYSLYLLVDTVLNLYSWCLIIWVIMSWLISFNVINTHNRFVHMVGDFLYRITEPALRPIRRFLPDLGGLD